MIESKTVIAKNGQTWDGIVYSVWGDGYELLFQTAMKENRQYSRTLAFNGLEEIKVPLGKGSPVLVSSGDPENQTVINIVQTPWN